MTSSSSKRLLSRQLFDRACDNLATVLPMPRQKKMWQWADENIIVPDIVGSPHPGPLNSGRLPIWRGFLKRLELQHVGNLKTD